MTLASCQKQPYQDGQQSGRQQEQQGEVVSLDRLTPMALILSFHGAARVEMRIAFLTFITMFPSKWTTHGYRQLPSKKRRQPVSGVAQARQQWRAVGSVLVEVHGQRQKRFRVEVPDHQADLE
jgi:hypothetical protein